jgi:hypothetical protein
MFTGYAVTFVTYILILFFSSKDIMRYLGLINFALVVTSDLM